MLYRRLYQYSLCTLWMRNSGAQILLINTNTRQTPKEAVLFETKIKVISRRSFLNHWPVHNSTNSVLLVQLKPFLRRQFLVDTRLSFLSKQYSVSLGDEARDNHAQQIERAEIANLVRSRMESLNLPVADYDDVSEKRNSLSYVIINPSCDLKLEEGDIVYLVRPSPFSAQKTFERHNSRRKSNISFCSAQLVSQMSAAVASAGLPGTGPGSRRGSGIGLPRAPPLGTTKSNSLSLPDSPTVAGTLRGRSNSLRVVDDILLRRSNSLRQGLTISRRKSSLEDIGLGALSHPSNHNPIKIALNGSIGLEVTPPEEGSQTMIGASNTGILDVGLPSMPELTAALGSNMDPALRGSLGGLYDSPNLQGPLGPQSPQIQGGTQDPQHIQGTIVWYNLMWGRRLSGVVRNKWL